MFLVTGLEKGAFWLLHGDFSVKTGNDIKSERPWLTELKSTRRYVIPKVAYRQEGMPPPRRVEVTAAWPLL